MLNALSMMNVTWSVFWVGFLYGIAFGDISEQEDLRERWKLFHKTRGSRACHQNILPSPPSPCCQGWEVLYRGHRAIASSSACINGSSSVTTVESSRSRRDVSEDCDVCSQLCERRSPGTGVECGCWRGFVWSATHCQDIDECLLDSNLCKPGGRCVNTVGSYVCRCAPGYRHMANGRCEDLDECSMATSIPLCTQACTNMPGHYKCSCHRGYTLLPGPGPGSESGKCVDLNECELQTDGCSHLCANTPGSYLCRCPAPLSLAADGFTCESHAKRHRKSPAGTSWQNLWQPLHNIYRSQPEFRSGRNSCGHRCLNGGTCQQGVCRCPPGLTGSVCQNDVDECMLLPYELRCAHHCTNTFGSFHCTCMEGWTLGADRRSCEHLSCMPACMGGGTCERGVCLCPPGLTGPACGMDVDECKENSHHCQHLCRNTLGSFACFCHGRHRLAEDGHRCLEPPCVPPCRNGGTCHSRSCSCVPGYFGRLCQLDENECLSKDSPCTHACVNSIGSYQCMCPSGQRLAPNRTACLVDSLSDDQPSGMGNFEVFIEIIVDSKNRRSQVTHVTMETKTWNFPWATSLTSNTHRDAGLLYKLISHTNLPSEASQASTNPEVLTSRSQESLSSTPHIESSRHHWSTEINSTQEDSSSLFEDKPTISSHYIKYFDDTSFIRTYPTSMSDFATPSLLSPQKSSDPFAQSSQYSISSAFFAPSATTAHSDIITSASEFNLLSIEPTLSKPSTYNSSLFTTPTLKNETWTEIIETVIVKYDSLDYLALLAPSESLVNGSGASTSIIFITDSMELIDIESSEIPVIFSTSNFDSSASPILFDTDTIQIIDEGSVFPSSDVSSVVYDKISTDETVHLSTSAFDYSLTSTYVPDVLETFRDTLSATPVVISLVHSDLSIANHTLDPISTIDYENNETDINYENNIILPEPFELSKEGEDNEISSLESNVLNPENIFEYSSTSESLSNLLDSSTTDVSEAEFTVSEEEYYTTPSEPISVFTKETSVLTTTEQENNEMDVVTTAQQFNAITSPKPIKEHKKKKSRRKNKFYPKKKLGNDLQVLNQILQSFNLHSIQPGDNKHYEIIDFDEVTPASTTSPTTLRSPDPLALPTRHVDVQNRTETDCYYDRKKYKSRSTFYRDEKNCTKCVCTDGLLRCAPRHCPPPHCEVPLHGDCCDYCPGDCVVDQQVYLPGEKFNPHLDPCRECRCKAGRAVCHDITCPPLACVQEFRAALPDECCPVCVPPEPGCFWNGRFFYTGQLWVSRQGGCQACLCKPTGVVQCNPVMCAIDCMHPQFLPGECCPVCEGCQHHGQQYHHEQKFEHPSDPCSICICQHGNISCFEQPCQTACSHPHKSPGKCCLECVDCFYQGQYISNGSNHTFDSGNDTCSECSCKAGEVMCRATTCLPGCTMDDGRVVSSGTQFSLGKDPCTKCRCEEGRVEDCRAEPCFVHCTHGVLLPGACCLDCSNCDHQGRLYKDLEVFRPNGEECQSCLCARGNILCEDVCESSGLEEDEGEYGEEEGDEE